MLPAARFTAAARITARRALRRHGNSPLTVTLAPSGAARAFSPDCRRIATDNDAGSAPTPRRVVAEKQRAAEGWKKGAPPGEAITPRPSPATPCCSRPRAVHPLFITSRHRSEGRRRFGCSAAGGGSAFRRGSEVFSSTRIGGNGGGGGGGGGGGVGRGGNQRLASAHATIGDAGGVDESSRDFAAVVDGTETYLVAARKLKAGCVVFDRVGGSLSDRRTRHSVQVREGLHLEADGDLIFMNHSCDPNCQLEVVEPRPDIPVGEKTTEDGSSGSPYLRVTVRAAEIRQEQLLTIDYDAMEIEMSSPFDCRCGADNCRGRVSGFANMAPAAQREYAGGGTAAAAATRRVVGGGRPTGPLPLTGAVKAWAKQNNLPRTR